MSTPDYYQSGAGGDNYQLYAAKYKLCLPAQEELKREIEWQKEIFRLEKGGSGDV